METAWTRRQKFSNVSKMPDDLFKRFSDGRTDLVWDLIEIGHDSTSLMPTCAYFGDVTAIRLLLSKGALNHELDLNSAAYHGHWKLCQFLLEQGADVNEASPETGETPLHSALSKSDTVVYDLVVQVLLAHGANPNAATIPGVETGAFMRDCRTKGETPLHRAAAFGETTTIDMLLKAGANREARDSNGDTPLSWASWHARPTPILRLLLYGGFHINPRNRSMRANLLGDP